MNACFGLIGAVLITLSCGCRLGRAQEVFTTPGPEATDLVARTRGVLLVNRAVGGIDSLRLPGQESATARVANSGLRPVYSLTGPDERGQIAFVEDDIVAKRHALKVLSSSGEESTIFEASGDAMWEHGVGGQLALDAGGRRVALVARARGRTFRKPDAYLLEGELEVWNIDARRRASSGPRALDDTLGFFPDGERLVYTALLARAEAAELLRAHVPASDAFGAESSSWSRIPVAHEFDLRTGLSRALHVGERPVLSPDGRRLLLRDRELHWRVLDLETNVSSAFAAPGAIHPGAIGFVDTNTVLFWAWPTEGAPIRFTQSNSPLIGPKQMRSLKLIDLRDGRFQTLVREIDPRRAVSFGR